LVRPEKSPNASHVADLDITLVTYETGVRLNLEKTDFEANSIRVSVRIGSGSSDRTQGINRASATSPARRFPAGGLGRHSADDLRRILAGKTVGVGFGGQRRCLYTWGRDQRHGPLPAPAATRDGPSITDPGCRPEAARQSRKSLDQMFTSFEHTAAGPGNLDIARLLVSGDTRFGFPPKEEMLKRNTQEVKAWVGPELARGAIEIALVGDLEIEATIAAVAQTLGALAETGPESPRMTN